MKCMSCSAEIPPAFIHSIQCNICAGCGGPIMNDQSQQLMQDLANAMTKMPNDPQGLAGWLLTNYRLDKIGDGSPTEHFHRKGAQIDESNLKIAQSPTDAFMKRAGANPKTEELLARVRNGKNKDLAMLASNIQGLDDEAYGFDEPSEEVDAEDFAALQELKKAGMNPFESNGGKSKAGIVTLGDDDMPMIPMMMPSEGEGQMLEGERALMATDEGRKVLNNERLRRLRAQESLDSGGGSFRRSS